MCPGAGTNSGTAESSRKLIGLVTIAAAPAPGIRSRYRCETNGDPARPFTGCELPQNARAVGSPRVEGARTRDPSTGRPDRVEPNGDTDPT